MDQTVFFDWFSTLFVPRVEKLEGHKLLFLDGHASHISIPVIELAVEKSIEIICLPPHSTHALQPLDVAVFSPAKRAWATILNNFYRESHAKGVSKFVFPSLFNKLYETAFTRAHAISGFEATGLFPLDKSKIKQKHLDQSLIHQPVSSTPISATVIQPSSSIESPILFSSTVIIFFKPGF